MGAGIRLIMQQDRERYTCVGNSRMDFIIADVRIARLGRKHGVSSGLGALEVAVLALPRSRNVGSVLGVEQDRYTVPNYGSLVTRVPGNPAASIYTYCSPRRYTLYSIHIYYSTI